MRSILLAGLAGSVSLMSIACFSAEAGSGAGASASRVDKIKGALPKLDPTNDDDWTDAGLPAMERMKALTGLDDLKRDEVGKAVPNFHRSNASAAPSDMSNVGKSETADDAGPTGDDGSTSDGGEPKTNAQKDDEAEKSELDEANERRDPNLDPKDNPNVGRDDLGPYEGQTHTADQGEYLAEQLSVEDMEPANIAAKYKDPIALLEAAVVAMNADERYRKNGELQQLIRHYSIAQVNIKSHQARLDKRFDATS